MKAAIYARVSTTDQTCENQLLELRGYAEARGWTVTREAEYPHLVSRLGEWDQGEHRLRLEQMFGDMPRGLFYWRCDRPLAQLGDAIRRVVRRNRIEYLVVDSIAYACGHAPEAADTAANYKRAVDRLRSLRDYFAVLDSRGGSSERRASLYACRISGGRSKTLNSGSVYSA